MALLFIQYMSSQIDHKNVFVVIPAYNEGTIIHSVIDELKTRNYGVIIVDDGSDDLLEKSLPNKNIFCLRHGVNLGQGAALQTGIEFALEKGAEYIVTFDADGQHNVNDIDALLHYLINKNFDIVLGSRFLSTKSKHVPPLRKLLLHAARYFNYLFTGLLLTDAHNGLRAMSRNAARQIQLQENRMAHATEILFFIKKSKLKYAEVPVTIIYTPYSRQKGQTALSSVRIFFDLLLNKIFK